MTWVKKSMDMMPILLKIDKNLRLPSTANWQSSQNPEGPCKLVGKYSISAMIMISVCMSRWVGHAGDGSHGGLALNGEGSTDGGAVLRRQYQKKMEKLADRRIRKDFMIII